MSMEKIIYTCRGCGSETDDEGIRELREWREKYWLDKKTGHYLCPDCYDDFRRKDLEGQLEELL